MMSLRALLRAQPDWPSDRTIWMPGVYMVRYPAETDADWLARIEKALREGKVVVVDEGEEPKH